MNPKNFTSILAADDPLLHPLKLGRQTFPGIWREIMPKEFLQLRFPEERQANCSNCPKACYESWRADYRCCTYHPRISNFLLGLATQTTEGDHAVDDLIARGMLLPEGMHSSPQQWLDFLDDQHENEFGRSQKVLCPMLDPASGFCRVHVFRNAVCSTYFCYKDQGSAGELFWSQIQTLGTQLEMRLGQWALREIGFDLEASLQAMDGLAPGIAHVSSDQGWKAEARQKLWANYWGREKELLKACAAVVIHHRQQLWDIARRQVIIEPQGFDKALLQLIPEQQKKLLEDEDEEWEEVDLPTLWEDCRDAHDALWEMPVGRFILSPNVSFVPNLLATDEEIYYRSFEYFIEYRFQNAQKTLAFRLAITADQLASLLPFKSQQLRIQDRSPAEHDFLKDMVHRKVLWIISE